MNRPPKDVDAHAECGECKHSPAYHDGDGGRPCRAWDPDQKGTYCACKGWKVPKPPPAPPSDSEAFE